MFLKRRSECWAACCKAGSTSDRRRSGLLCAAQSRGCACSVQPEVEAAPAAAMAQASKSFVGAAKVHGALVHEARTEGEQRATAASEQAAECALAHALQREEPQWLSTAATQASKHFCGNPSLADAADAAAGRLPSQDFATLAMKLQASAPNFSSEN